MTSPLSPKNPAPSEAGLQQAIQLLQNETDLTRRAEIMSEIMEQRYAANPLKYEYQRI